MAASPQIEKQRGAMTPTRRAGAFVLEHSQSERPVAVNAGYTAFGDPRS